MNVDAAAVLAVISDLAAKLAQAQARIAELEAQKPAGKRAV